VIDQAAAHIGKQLAIHDSYEFIEKLLKAKDNWLDLSDDIHDVTSFYKTQVTTWRKMLDALGEFADNREALQQDLAAANTLKELESIRDNPAPYV
jgi:endonuclease III-like uncharacterized protein